MPTGDRATPFIAIAGGARTPPTLGFACRVGNGPEGPSRSRAAAHLAPAAEAAAAAPVCRRAADCAPVGIAFRDHSLPSIAVSASALHRAATAGC